MGDNVISVSGPDAHEVAALLQGARRRWRNKRSFSDWYSSALAGVLVVVGLISIVLFNAWAPSGCAGPSCSAGVEGVSVAVILLFSLTVHAAGLLVGPISVNPAEAFWVFSSPVDRRPLMLRRKVALLLRTLLAGVAAGIVHSWLWSANPWWLLAFVGAAAAAMALAMLQEGKRSRIGSATAWALFIGAVASGAASTSPAFMGVSINATAVPGAVALVAVLVLLLTGGRAWGIPENLPLPVLRRVQGARDAVAGAVSSADSGLLLDVIWARLLARRSFVTPFRLRTTGWAAVLEAETRRCLRSPLLLSRTLVLVTVAAVASVLGLQVLHIGISLATMVFASLNASTLRLYATSSGLARSFPQSAASMRLLLALPTALLILGLVLLASVIAAFVPGAPVPLPGGLAILTAALAGLAGGIRWSTAAPTQFSAGIVMTEMGPIHVSALLNAIRGIDAAVLLSLPAVLGLTPMVSLAVPLAGLLWLLLRG